MSHGQLHENSWGGGEGRHYRFPHASCNRLSSLLGGNISLVLGKHIAQSTECVQKEKSQNDQEQGSLQLQKRELVKWMSKPVIINNPS